MSVGVRGSVLHRVNVVMALIAVALVGPASAAGGPGRYTNPVLPHDFPDPTVIQAPDGWYYAYGTETDTPSGHVNIQLARSADLVHWTYLGDALPSLPAWGDRAAVSWAPDVVRQLGRYYLFYS